MTCDFKPVPCRSVKGRCAILDVETTGLNPKISEVLQLAIVDSVDGGVVLNDFYDVHSEEWPEAQAVNRITKEMVRGLPFLKDEAAEVSEILAKFDVIAGYNICFDLQFLRNAGVRIPRVPIVDLMVDYSEMKGEYVLKRWKLSQACAWAGCELLKAHDAVTDSLATLALYNKLREDFRCRHATDTTTICTLPIFTGNTGHHSL